MPKKVYTKTGNSCRVTFTLPPEVKAKSIYVCGDFNDWSKKSHKMHKRKDGTHYLVVYLDSGASYRYKFYLGNGKWENDWAAEAYEPNEFGEEHCVITV
ncbi:MAG: glycoside hydrolase [Ectothiorhodospiraceae bacterium]|nr:glycoside hydrolase [Ectothiorhodospiraceae bacterium]